jgi:glycosyltransferase involved in cell wall biosynthesis
MAPLPVAELNAAPHRSPASMAAAPPLWPARAAARLRPGPDCRPPRQLHVVPSLALGGAERIVADLATAWGEIGAEADIVVLRQAEREHRIEGPTTRLHRLGHLRPEGRLDALAAIAAGCGAPAAYCHLSTREEMAALWRAGIATIPVVHNDAAGWRQDPRAWQRDSVPFVIACGEAVAAALDRRGLKKPIRVLRHIVPDPTPMAADRRRRLREAFGAGPATLLIGMIGRIVRQKRYDRALDLLAKRGDAKLVIIGAARDVEGRGELAALVGKAHALGVRDRLVLPGAVDRARELLGVFDLFLNTSDFEGVSIATMEAVAAGVPAVVADVGGQAEIGGLHLVSATAGAAEWLRAIDRALAAPEFSRPDRRARTAAAAIWPWLAALGPGGRLGPSSADALFVTGNLDIGGAQRSLVNLAGAMTDRRIAVGVCGPVGVPEFASLDGSAAVFDLRVGGGLAGRVGSVLALARALAPRTLLFWNLDAATKLAVGKVLAGGPIRVIDVSPGPMLFRELELESELAENLAWPTTNYAKNLDGLIVKYSGGLPPRQWPAPRDVQVIPNGVPLADPRLAIGDGPAPPRGSDPGLAVAVVSRLVPAKKLHLLPAIAQKLERLVPGATLTLIGAVHEARSDSGWQALREAAGAVWPANFHIAGGDHRTLGFLHRFALLLMASEAQGCPNVSLEAMACGLPVVANDDGGTREQVIDGVTGRLVATQPDPALAEALAIAAAELLRDPERRRALGCAAKRHVRENFSMAAMAAAYRAILPPAPTEREGPCSSG